MAFASCCLLDSVLFSNSRSSGQGASFGPLSGWVTSQPTIINRLCAAASKTLLLSSRTRALPYNCARSRACPKSVNFASTSALPSGIGEWRKYGYRFSIAFTRSWMAIATSLAALMKPAYASFCCACVKLIFWRIVACSSCRLAVYQPDPAAIAPTTKATIMLARASQNSFDRFSFLTRTSSLGGAGSEARGAEPDWSPCGFAGVDSPSDGRSPVGDADPEDVSSCAGVGSSTGEPYWKEAGRARPRHRRRP